VNFINGKCNGVLRSIGTGSKLTRLKGVKRIRLNKQDRIKGDKRILGLTQPAVGYAVERGERPAEREKYDVLDFS
jgi:hypothetical protein